ncbi:MAG: DUF3667 domain-containing protein [Lewinellaceae bacterium]|nr:DUF3667 domain-containing protein [Lewinellaceae bacterium]
MTSNSPPILESGGQAIAGSVNCKTCNTPFDGAFCPSCGQKVLPGRFTLRMLFSQLIGMITNIERGFWHTFWMLLVRPWVVIEDYLAQRTRPYYDPFRFLFIMTGIASVFIIGLGLFDYQMENMNELMQLNQTAQQQAFQQGTMTFIRKYFNIMSLLIIPFFTLGARLIFRSRRFNLAEFIIVFSFLYGELQLISLVIQMAGFFVFHLKYNWIIISSMGVSIAYYAYALKPIFGYSYPGTVLRAVTAQLLGFIFFMVASLILGLIIGLAMVFMGLKPGG